MNTPLISVVIPVYNTEEYLSTTIEMLIKQTYKNLEIILVDDGSTDNSGKICDEYAQKDSRIKVIHQKNSGVSFARNAGMDIAKGDYIGFCDSDDLPDNDLYETLYNLANKHNCDLAMVKSAIHFTNGSVQKLETNNLKIYASTEDVLKDFLIGRIHMGIYTKLFSKELCDKVRFDTTKKINEDKFFCFEALMAAKKICYKDICKYNYCRHDNSSSKAEFSEKYFDVIFFADKIESIISKDYPDLRDYAVANKISSYLRFMMLTVMLNGENKFLDKQEPIIKYLKNTDSKFAKKYLSRNNYIKLELFKLGRVPFKFLIKHLSKK